MIMLKNMAFPITRFLMSTRIKRILFLLLTLVYCIWTVQSLKLKHNRYLSWHQWMELMVEMLSEVWVIMVVERAIWTLWRLIGLILSQILSAMMNGVNWARELTQSVLKIWILREYAVLIKNYNMVYVIVLVAQAIMALGLFVGVTVHRDMKTMALPVTKA